MRAVVWMVVVAAACHDTTPAHEPAARSAPAAPRIDLADPLALLPADSDLVLTIDVAALRTSPLWKQYGHETLALIAPGLADCGYDPLAELSTITAGIPAADDAEGIFVFRGIDRDKMLGCLRTSTKQTDTTATFDGDFVRLTNKSGAVNLVTFVDPRTMVMQGSKHPTKQTLTAALRVGAPLRHDAAYVAAAARLPRGAAVAMVMRPGSRGFAAKFEEKIGTTVSGFAFTLDLTDRLTMHGSIELASADVARKLVEAARPQMEASKGYIDHFDVQADGNTVRLELGMTEAQLRAIAAIVKSGMAAASQTN